MQSKLEIGQIVNTFGIKGEIKVSPLTDDIKRFDYLEEVYVKTKKETKIYKVENVRYHKNMVLLKLENINTPEQAELLKNAFLEVDREHAVPLEEGTYFIADLHTHTHTLSRCLVQLMVIPMLPFKHTWI